MLAWLKAVFRRSEEEAPPVESVPVTKPQESDLSITPIAVTDDDLAREVGQQGAEDSKGSKTRTFFGVQVKWRF